MAQHNSNKLGMASDLCLGRPSSCSDNMDDRPVFSVCESALINGSINYSSIESVMERQVAGLECYVRALHGEREKLDAFRREVPICMDLLDQAIQDSRMKLAKAVQVASSRSVASLASYNGNHFNNDGSKDDENNNAAAYAYLSKEHQQEQLAQRKKLAGRVQNTAKSSISDEEGSAADGRDGQLRMWGAASTCRSKHAHAQSFEYNKQPQPHVLGKALEATTGTLNSTLHDQPSLQLQTSTVYPIYNTCQVAAPRPLPQLQLINSHENPYYNRPFNQDVEVSTHNLSNSPIIEPMNQLSRVRPSNAREFSSSNSHVENVHGLMTREASNFQGMILDNLQEQDRPSSTMMTSSSQYNNAPSSTGGQTPRKARRCWSPELHQRFLHALQQLGGPQLATPKQIREVMHVEGLTNDEVKSHLQKFRLHTRRPAPMQVGEPAQQPHHLVLFGGIWMPSSPAESAPAVAACQIASSGHPTSSPGHNSFMQFQHVIGQNPMHALLSATSAAEQLNVLGGMEPASEVDVARSDQSSQNGEAAGIDNNHEEEDTEIHLASKPPISKEITSPVACKARYP